MNQLSRFAIGFVLLALTSCNCGEKLIDSCGDCATGYVCQDNQCKKGCVTDDDCPLHDRCIAGVCLCADETCLGSGGGSQPPTDSGSTGGLNEGPGGGIERPHHDAGEPDAGAPYDAGIPDAGPLDAGQPIVDAGPMCGPTQKLCNGACVDQNTCCNCCYQCEGGDFYTATAHCNATQVDGFDDGGCPTGYSSTQQDCRPCWDCRVSNAYCVTPGCCGDWVDAGVVGGGCTCYGCQGFAYDFDKDMSCEKAETWSHGGGPSPNPTNGCIWPMGANQSFCGYSPGNCSCFLIACGGSCAL